jgi:hypothetical protein
MYHLFIGLGKTFSQIAQPPLGPFAAGFLGCRGGCFALGIACRAQEESNAEQPNFALAGSHKFCSISTLAGWFGQCCPTA